MKASGCLPSLAGSAPKPTFNVESNWLPERQRGGGPFTAELADSSIQCGKYTIKRGDLNLSSLIARQLRDHPVSDLDR